MTNKLLSIHQGLYYYQEYGISTSFQSNYLACDASVISSQDGTWHIAAGACVSTSNEWWGWSAQIPVSVRVSHGVTSSWAEHYTLFASINKLVRGIVEADLAMAINFAQWQLQPSRFRKRYSKKQKMKMLYRIKQYNNLITILPVITTAYNKTVCLAPPKSMLHRRAHLLAAELRNSQSKGMTYA